MSELESDPHLGDQVAALVDGELDYGARDHALEHLARCPQCRAEVDAQRQVKAALAALSEPDHPPGLTERLLHLPELESTQPQTAAALSGTGEVSAGHGADVASRPLHGRHRGAATPTRPAGGPSGSTRPRTGRPGLRRRAQQRLAAATAGGLTAFALTLAAVILVGGGEPNVIQPPVSTFTVEHTKVTGGVPGSDSVAGMVDATNFQ